MGTLLGSCSTVLIGAVKILRYIFHGRAGAHVANVVGGEDAATKYSICWLAPIRRMNMRE